MSNSDIIDLLERLKEEAVLSLKKSLETTTANVKSIVALIASEFEIGVDDLLEAFLKSTNQTIETYHIMNNIGNLPKEDNIKLALDSLCDRIEYSTFNWEFCLLEVSKEFRINKEDLQYTFEEEYGASIEEFSNWVRLESSDYQRPPAVYQENPQLIAWKKFVSLVAESKELA